MSSTEHAHKRGIRKPLPLVLIGWLVLFVFHHAQAREGCAAPGTHVKQSIVLIDAGSSLGSGIVIGRNKVLTAAHVVADSGDVTISAGNTVYPGSVIALRKDSDLALIQTPDLHLPTLPFATRSRRKNEAVWAMGYPFGRSLIATSGRYKGLWSRALYTSASVNFGQSGGGLVACENGHHVLAGVVRAFGANRINGKLVRRDDISVATAIDDVRRFLAVNRVALKQTGQ